MDGEDTSAEFADLLARHRDVVLGLLRFHEGSSSPTRRQGKITSAEEIMLRSRIVAWAPTNGRDAYRKLEHLVQAMAAGVPIDKTAVDLAIRSAEAFYIDP